MGAIQVIGSGSMAVVLATTTEPVRHPIVFMVLGCMNLVIGGALICLAIHTRENGQQ